MPQSLDVVLHEKVSARENRNKEAFKEVPYVKIPGKTFPHAGFKNALWITLQAMEIESIITGGRGSIRTGKKKTLFKFLAPAQILETHVHDWEEYKSIQSRLLEKLLTLEAGTEKIGGIFTNLKRQFQSTKKLPAGQRIKAALQGFSYAIPKYKVDSPLSYTGSRRRQWQFTFQLASADGGADIVQAVKLLQKYAAPRSKGTIAIDFPHVFSINTEPKGLLKVNYAALQSVTPTWKAPYIDGYPILCELAVEFRDMSPLFERTITEGSLINVKTTREPTTDLRGLEGESAKANRASAPKNRNLVDTRERRFR
jgi:hypothetical protein